MYRISLCILLYINIIIYFACNLYFMGICQIGLYICICSESILKAIEVEILYMKRVQSYYKIAIYLKKNCCE